MSLTLQHSLQSGRSAVLCWLMPLSGWCQANSVSMVSVSTMIIVLRDHIITVLNWREKKTLQHHTMFLEISFFFYRAWFHITFHGVTYSFNLERNIYKVHKPFSDSRLWFCLQASVINLSTLTCRSWLPFLLCMFVATAIVAIHASLLENWSVPR